MLRFENEVIVVVRLEQRDDFVATRALPQAMAHLPAKIRAPPAKIIVYVNDRDAGVLRPLFQAQKFARHRTRVAQERIRLREIEVINDVDEEQRRDRFVRRAPVQVGVFSWHSAARIALSVSFCRRISSRPSCRLCARTPCSISCRDPTRSFSRPCPTCSRSPRRGSRLPFSRLRASRSLPRCVQLSVSVSMCSWI